MAGVLWLLVILVSIVAVIGGSRSSCTATGNVAATALVSASKIRLAFVLFFSARSATWA